MTKETASSRESRCWRLFLKRKSSSNWSTRTRTFSPFGSRACRIALDEAHRAPAERGLEEGPVHLGVFLGPEDLGGVQRFGEVPDRVLAGPEDGDPPGRARLRHDAAVERRDEPRADEGRLAAAGRADDGEETAPAEPGQDLVDAGLAPEEEVVLVGLEAAKPRERIGASFRIEHHASSYPAWSWLRKGCIAAGSKVPRWWMTSASWVRNRALHRRVGRPDEDRLRRDRLLSPEGGALLDLAELGAQPELVPGAVVDEDAVADREVLLVVAPHLGLVALEDRLDDLEALVEQVVRHDDGLLAVALVVDQVDPLERALVEERRLEDRAPAPPSTAAPGAGAAGAWRS